MTDEWAGGKNASGRVRDSGGQTAKSAEREVKRSRRRKGVKARPNTCSTSPSSIRAAQRRAKALDLRVQGYTFEAIGMRLGVSKAQAARDIDSAVAEVTVEPAKELLKLELRRCDELMSAHYADACNGDVTATNTVLRIMAHRAMLMGWSRDQQGAARVVISDGVGAGGEPRRLELEFVLPGQRIIDMERLDELPPPRSSYDVPQSSHAPSRPPSSSPRIIDALVNAPISMPIVQPKKGPGSWMD
jgi:hypothetical protein